VKGLKAKKLARKAKDRRRKLPKLLYVMMATISSAFLARQMSPAGGLTLYQQKAFATLTAQEDFSNDELNMPEVTLQTIKDNWGRREEQKRLFQKKPIIRRMLFGIFTCDTPNEYNLRETNRDTLLRFFKNRARFVREQQRQNEHQQEREQQQQQQHNDIIYALTDNNTNDDIICSLSELMTNKTLAMSNISCRFVFTFVMGGGDGGNHSNQLTQKKKTILPFLQKTMSISR